MSNLIKRGPTYLLANICYGEKEPEGTIEETQQEVIIPQTTETTCFDKIDEIRQTIEIATTNNLPANIRKEFREYLENKHGISLDIRDSGLTCILKGTDKIRGGEAVFYKTQNGMDFFKVYGRRLILTPSRFQDLEAIRELFNLEYHQECHPKSRCYRYKPDYSSNETPQSYPFPHHPTNFEYPIKLVNDDDLLIAEIFNCKHKDYEEFSIFNRYQFRNQLTHLIIEGFYHAQWRQK